MERQDLPYISYMPRDAIESFIKAKIHEILHRHTNILICNWKYAPKIRVDFLMKDKRNRIIKCVARFEDFKFEIVINRKKQEFNKDWAQYMCDVLSERALDGIDFSPCDYKKQYNAYWEKVRQYKMAKAEQECDERLFK